MKRDGITADKARQWIAKQWKQDEVIKRADYEIINDGQHNISQQIDTLLNKL
jgi:dephospho-CoA kinase